MFHGNWVLGYGLWGMGYGFGVSGLGDWLFSCLGDWLFRRFFINSSAKLQFSVEKSIISCRKNHLHGLWVLGYGLFVLIINPQLSLRRAQGKRNLKH